MISAELAEITNCFLNGDSSGLGFGGKRAVSWWSSKIAVGALSRAYRPSSVSHAPAGLRQIVDGKKIETAASWVLTHPHVRPRGRGRWAPWSRRGVPGAGKLVMACVSPVQHQPRVRNFKSLERAVGRDRGCSMTAAKPLCNEKAHAVRRRLK